jgi:hypothetical protein
MSSNLHRLCKVIRGYVACTSYKQYVVAMRTVTAPGFIMPQGMNVQGYLDYYVRNLATEYNKAVPLSNEDRVAFGKGMMHVALNTDYGKP